MRDARSQSAQERRGRRTRRLARRILILFFKLIGVIALWFAALQIWDVPALTRRLLSLGGLLRLAAGTIFASSAIVMLVVSVPFFDRDALSFIAIGTFLAALGCELLIGDDLRRAWRGR